MIDISPAIKINDVSGFSVGQRLDMSGYGSWAGLKRTTVIVTAINGSSIEFRLLTWMERLSDPFLRAWASVRLWWMRRRTEGATL